MNAESEQQRIAPPAAGRIRALMRAMQDPARLIAGAARRLVASPPAQLSSPACAMSLRQPGLGPPPLPGERARTRATSGIANPCLEGKKKCLLRPPLF